MQICGKYKMFRTDDTFEYNGGRFTGIPFVLDAQMRDVEHLNSYLLDRSAYGGLRSDDSRSKAARIIIKFQDFCDRVDVHWLEAERKHLYRWREELLQPGDRQALAVNECIGRVCDLYEYARDKRLIAELPFGKKTVPFLRRGGVILRNAQVNELTLKTRQTPVRFLRKEQVPLFIRELANVREILMAREGVQLGMRRDEITRQTIDVLPDPSGHPPGEMIWMVLDPEKTPTKGHRYREVLLTPALAKDLWEYKERHRPILAEKYRRKYGRETNLLFLSDDGNPLPRNYLNKVFTKAAKRAGMRITPHMLRHTYATYAMLYAMKTYQEEPALEWVRDRLGHASVVTTERYVHTAKLVSVKLMVDYQRHIDGLVTGEM